MNISNNFEKIASKTGYFITENLPLGTTIGIDLKCWNTDEKFRGFKFIPPGLHFIFFSSNDKHGNTSIRCGFFEWFDPGKVIFKSWDSNSETLNDSTTNLCGDFTNCQENLVNIDSQLALYPYDEIIKMWLSLTNFISKNLFMRLNPKFISPCPSYKTQQFKSTSGKHKKLESMEVDDDSNPNPSSNKSNEETLNELLSLDLDYKIRYTDIPKRMLHPANSNAADITKHNLDSTFTLQTILKKICSLNSTSTIPTADNNNNNDSITNESSVESREACRDMLGELQFAFICFMYGHHFESFDQWKQLVLLICNSLEAIASPAFSQFYLDFIGVLYYHIREIPPDFFIDICDGTNQNFLISTLSIFFDTLAETQLTTSLQTGEGEEDDRKKLNVRALNFKRYLRKNCGFKFRKSTRYPEDEAPVIVE